MNLDRNVHFNYIVILMAEPKQFYTKLFSPPLVTLQHCSFFDWQLFHTQLFLMKNEDNKGRFIPIIN